MTLLLGLASLVLGLAYLFSGTPCPTCKKGKLSRDLTGWGKKAECTHCHKIFDVEWL